MLPPSVLAEFLAVIRGEDDRGALSLARVERVPELPDLRVGVANLVVVERRQVPDVPLGRARELADLQMVDLVAGERAAVARVERRLPARPIGRRVRVVRIHQEKEEEKGLAPVGREPLRRAARRLSPRRRDRGDLVRHREEGREALGEAVAGVERRVGEEGRGGPARAAKVRRDRGHAGDDAERRAVGAFLRGRDAAGQEGGHRRDRPGGRGVDAIEFPRVAEDRVEIGARGIGAAIESDRVAPRRVEHQEEDRVRPRIGPHHAQVGEEERPGGIQPQPQARPGARSGELPVLVEELGRAGPRGEPPCRAPDRPRGAAAGGQQLRDERDVRASRRRGPGEAQASARVSPAAATRRRSRRRTPRAYSLRVHESLRGTGGGRRPQGRNERVTASGERQEKGEEDRASPARAGHRPSLMQHL